MSDTQSTRLKSPGLAVAPRGARRPPARPERGDSPQPTPQRQARQIKDLESSSLGLQRRTLEQHGRIGAVELNMDRIFGVLERLTEAQRDLSTRMGGVLEVVSMRGEVVEQMITLHELEGHGQLITVPRRRVHAPHLRVIAGEGQTTTRKSPKLRLVTGEEVSQ